MTSPSAFSANQRTRIRTFLSAFSTDTPPSVPYDDAIRHVAMLQTTSKSQHEMSVKLAQSQEAAAKLEREQVTWSLGQQLLQSRLKDEEKRAAEMEAERERERERAVAAEGHVMSVMGEIGVVKGELEEAKLALERCRKELSEEKKKVEMVKMNQANQINQINQINQNQVNQVNHDLNIDHTHDHTHDVHDSHVVPDGHQKRVYGHQESLMDASFSEGAPPASLMDESFGEFTSGGASAFDEPPAIPPRGQDTMSSVDVWSADSFGVTGVSSGVNGVSSEFPGISTGVSTSTYGASSSTIVPTTAPTSTTFTTTSSHSSSSFMDIDAHDLASSTTPPPTTTNVPIPIPTIPSTTTTPTIPSTTVRFTVSRDSPSTSLQVTQDQLDRESLIKRHFETRVHQLIAQLQSADGTVMSLQSRLGDHKEALSRARREQKVLQEALKEAQADAAEVRDTLMTTETNYKTQMNLMTEHIFSLNEQLEEAGRRRRAAAAAVGERGKAPATPPRGRM